MSPLRSVSSSYLLKSLVLLIMLLLILLFHQVEVHATAVHHEILEPKVAHAQQHEISHSQAVSMQETCLVCSAVFSVLKYHCHFPLQTYSVRRVEMGESRSVYVTLAFAGVALMVALLIGVVVLRKRSSRFPSHQVISQGHSPASYLNPIPAVVHPYPKHNTTHKTQTEFWDNAVTTYW